MNRIIITGGAGFIGSHLCKRLLEEGNEVICIDNFYTGSKSNVIDLLDNKNFEIIRHDIIDPIRLEADQIYNFACPASPKHYQHNPVDTMRTNVVGTMNMLNIAKKSRATILQASTSEVYGDPTVHPQTESYLGNVNPIGIRSCYDEGKRAAESLMMDYKRMYNVDAKIIRIFNTYGPNMSEFDGRVISNFIVQALEHEPITIYGDGSQTRSFCYVDDLVEAIIRMMIKRDFAGPLNLGNPEEYTVKEIAETIIKMTNSNSEIKYMPLPEDDPKQRKPDITLASERLAWKPTVALEDGLKLTIEYFKDVIKKRV